ncbi:MAG: inositol monophosphatase family protein [Bacteroidota bacterium]|nr:inositol monophosphatase family protein [Bacteroidota bacterium]MDP4230230.1 inositol monophosphatase family protein [Bacteroidota bacterium]
MISNSESKGYLDLAIRLSREAGIFALAEQSKALRIERKTNQFDLVTHVDKRNEEYIQSEVAKIYPDHEYLGEEGASTKTNSGIRWIVDPIDGTINFAHGLPIWCVSIGVEVGGQIECGAIYDATRDEMFTAIRGGGAHLNGKPIHVSEITDHGLSLFVTGFAYDIAKNEDKAIERFDAFLHRGLLVRRLGSAALDLCYTACGRFDGFFEAHLAPWDSAAGSLIVCEAGGMITHYDGSDYSIYRKGIIASNGLQHELMKDIINSV